MKPKSPSPKKIQEGRAQADFEDGPTIARWKCRCVSIVQDFPPIHGKYNPYLGTERKIEMHMHLTQIAKEYAQSKREEIQLLKARAPYQLSLTERKLLSSPTSIRTTRH